MIELDEKTVSRMSMFTLFGGLIDAWAHLASGPKKVRKLGVNAHNVPSFILDDG